MKMSDIVARYILDMLESSEGSAEIQRNELAQSIGCVPSQINYVLTSRFTPEQGYIVESRRGGGGYIKITRVQMNKNSALMHTIYAIGSSIDLASCRAIINNLLYNEIITNDCARLMLSATSDKSYAEIPVIIRDRLRSSIIKNMLISLV